MVANGRQWYPEKIKKKRQRRAMSVKKSRVQLEFDRAGGSAKR